MHTFLARALALLFVLSCLAPASSAVDSGGSITVPVTYSGRLTSIGSQYRTEYRLQLGTSDYWYYDENGAMSTIETEPQVVKLEPGRPYTMQIEAVGYSYYFPYEEPAEFEYELSMSTMEGFVVLVSGLPHGAQGGAYGTTTVSVVVAPASECSLCGPGSDYALTTRESGMRWQVLMGRDTDGSPVSPVVFAAEAVSAASFSRNELNFASFSPTVTRLPAAGPLRQVVLPNALLDVVDVVQQSVVVGMELRFYPIAAKGTLSGGAYTIKPGYTPYVSYVFKRLVSDGSQCSLKRTAGWVEERVLTRGGNGRWSTSYPLASLGTKEITSPSTNTDQIVWKNPDGTVARQETRTYTTTVSNQRELVSLVDGENRSSTWTYYGDTSFPGSTGKLNIATTPEGGYAVYTYHNEAGPAVGRVARIYQPYADTPAVFVNNHATLSQGRMTAYSWTPDFNGVATLLNNRLDFVGGVEVGRTTATHSFDYFANGRRLLTSAFRTYSSSSAYTELATKEYAADPAMDPLYHNKPYSLRRPDGTQVSYVQQRGTWNGSSFSPGSTGDDWRTTETSGFATQPSSTASAQMSSSDGVTIEPIWVVPYRSTRRVLILDNGNAVRDELHVCTSGSSFVLVTRTDRVYAQTGEIQTEKRFDVATELETVLYDSTWTDGRKSAERDAQGVRRTFAYDARGRLDHVVTQGLPGATNGLGFDRTTIYTYDGADQLVQTTVSGVYGGTIVSKTRYDLGGRVRESEAPGGFITRYDYNTAARTLTRTFPYSGGATTIETSYRDGRIKEIDGTAAVRTLYSYMPESDGREKTTVQMLDASVNPDANPGPTLVTVSESWQDWTSRASSSLARRGDDALALRTDYGYDSAGRLARVDLFDAAVGGARVGRARLFGYDPALALSAQALDENDNGLIDKASMDRIGDSDAQFVLEGTSWWLEQASGIYDKDNDGTSRDLVRQQTRLSGFPAGMLYQVRHINALGQQTTSTTTFNFADSERLLVTTVDLPGIGGDQVTTVRNGLVATLATPQGQTYTFTYDQFGRESGRHDPRKGWNSRTYLSGTNLVWREQDEEDLAAAAYTATYDYDTAGRVSVVTDRLGRTTRFAYTARGQLEKRWGSAAMPVRYEYNTRGQVRKMHTYRGGSDWNAVEWPTATTGDADTTEWVYLPNSGLLQEKRDAEHTANNPRKVSYTYEPDGLVKTRTWARGVSTTYGYDPQRQLTSKTYSDTTTPAITGLTYNRRGQLKTVTDVTGTRTFHYDALGQLQHEELPAYFGSRVVDYDYDDFGRRAHLGLYSTANGTNEPTNALFTQDYVYDPTTGRLGSLNTSSSGNGNGGMRSTSYGYHANSNQLHTMANTWARGGYTVTRLLEPRRDAVSSWAMATTESGSAYEPIRATYARDALGRIQAASFDNSTAPDWYPLFRGHASDAELRVGDVANPSTTPGFLYNDRGELTAHNVTAKVGTNWQAIDKQSMDRTSTFGYDNAQNRDTGTVLSWTGVPMLDDSAADAVNEPGTLVGLGVTYDLDGNLTNDGFWTYSYDAENRLVRSQKNGTEERIDYAYDYMSRRVSMERYYAPGSFKKRYVWDGWHIIADLWSGYGNALGSTFAWGLDVSGSVGGAGGVGGLVVQYYNGRAFLPLQDGQGNIRGYVDTTNGKNAVAWDFTPYGETIKARGGLSGAYGLQDFPFRHQSKMQDTDGHLIYYGLRYYHPKLGRFVNRDPSGESGGLNLHAFVGNDPANRWDLLGLDPNPDLWELISTDENGDQLWRSRLVGDDISVSPELIVHSPSAVALREMVINESRDQPRPQQLTRPDETTEGSTPTSGVGSSQTGSGAPNNTPPPRNHCHELVDHLVAQAERAQTGFSEILNTRSTGMFYPGQDPSANAMSAFGYVSGVGTGMMGTALSLQFDAQMVNPITGMVGQSDVNGFHEYLVDHRQRSDVIKHVLMNAGAELSGRPVGLVVGGGMTLFDYAEFRVDQLGNRPGDLRRVPEVLGDFAGTDAGKLMRDYAINGGSSNELRDSLRKRLCAQ